jgi:cobalt/nickel transport system permease protein
MFALTQVPLAVVEGLLTVAVFNLLTRHSARELRSLAVLR